MKDILISRLRDTDASMAEFRDAADKLALILAGEAAEHLPRTSYEVMTPIAPTQGSALARNIVLVPILRSGLILLKAFMHFYPDAAVGFVGTRRDEETAQPHLYYENLPSVGANDTVIVLDPMIATGGSASMTIEILKKKGITEEQMLFVGVISADPGLNRVKTSFPKMKIIVAQQDRDLNDDKFIVPGLGDFGDRYFGTS